MAKKAFVYDGTQWVDIAQSTADLSNYANMTTTPISGFRNSIINGDFKINQRGFTSTTTTNAYGFDRWQLITNNGTCTYSSVAFTAGNAISGYEPINHARMVTSGQTLASAYSLLVQKIEDVRTFAGQTITISFWAKAASGTPKVAIETEQFFGTGGSPSANVHSYAGQVTLSTSWDRYSVTVTVPSISGKTIGTTTGTSFIELNLWTSAGTDYSLRTNSLGIQSTTVDFWGVQVERGTVATPFEQRPIGTELSLCQRYYYRIVAENTYGYFASGTTHTTTNGVMIVNFPVKLRATPNLFGVSSVSHFGLISPLFSNLSTISISSDGTNSNNGAVVFTGSFTAGHGVVVRANNNASAWMEFGAEL
jgi:hypothetical protein